jgi:RHS repeat-associated protein
MTRSAIPSRFARGTNGWLTQDTKLASNVYTYDEGNRLTSVDGVPYSWDANGNLLNDGSRTYTYDHANRLTAASDQHSAFSFAYNGLGDRLQQTENGVTTNYTLDIESGLTQVLSDGGSTYLYGVGRIAQADPGSRAYYLGDALNSARQLVDDTGRVGLGRAYEPYGDPLSIAGEMQTAYGFAGEWRDATGLINLRARYYAPGEGRFTAADVWSGNPRLPLTQNPFQYGNSNPITFKDPSGHWCLAGFDVGLGRGCTEEEREGWARTIQGIGGLVSSPNFAVGYLYEILDIVTILGPGVQRLILNEMLERSPNLQLAVDAFVLASLKCGADGPLQVLAYLRNGLSSDIYTRAGRVAGRLTALALGITELSVTLVGAAVFALAAPVSFGLTIGGSAAAVAISAQGAAVVANAAVKELNDHLIAEFFSGRPSSSRSGGSLSLTPQQREIRDTLLDEHPQLHPDVATKAAQGSVRAAGPGGRGADVILANGRGREVSVHTGAFTPESVGSHLVAEARQEGVNEIFLQLNTPGASRQGLLQMMPDIRRAYSELSGMEIQFFGPDGLRWWNGIFAGP